MKIHLRLGRAKRRRVEGQSAAVPLDLDIPSQDASELGFAADNFAGRPLSPISSASSSSSTASSLLHISPSFLQTPPTPSDYAPLSPPLPPSLDPNRPDKASDPSPILRTAPYLPEADLPPPDVVRSRGEQISNGPDWFGKTVWRLSWRERWWVVKGGKGVEMSEAEMTKVAWERTGLPVPRVYGVITLNDETFIYLEDLPGTLLSHIYPFLSASQIINVEEDLRRLIHTMQSTRAPPETPVGGMDSSNLYALVRRNQNAGPTKPSPSFPSSADFASWLHGLFLAGRGRFTSIGLQERKWRKNGTSQFDLASPLILVHGDLQAHNILVDEEGRLTGLIDWEYAGWFPAWVEGFPGAVTTYQRMGEEAALIAGAVFESAGVPLRSYRMLIDLHKVAKAALYSEDT